MGENDLLAESLDGSLKLEVQINNHGQLGLIKQGDIFGSADTMIKPPSKDILVQVVEHHAADLVANLHTCEVGSVFV